MNQPIKQTFVAAGVRHHPMSLWLTLLVLLAMPITATAANLDWSPLSMDIGQVPIGTTQQGTLTLTNTDAVDPMSIDSVEFTFNQQGQFSFTTSKSLPTDLLPGESMEVVISFTPIAQSFSSANILVTNDSENAGLLNYYIQGEGVVSDACYPQTDCSGTCTDLQTDVNNCGGCNNACPSVANGTPACVTGSCTFTCDEGYERVGDSCQPIISGTPLQMLQYLIAYANNAIADGSLVGLGAGNSADQRRNAFMHMLNNAETLLASSQLDQACGQLRSAQIRTDGGYPFVVPMDFVAGGATYTLSQDLLEIMSKIADMYPAVNCEPITPVSPPRHY